MPKPRKTAKSSAEQLAELEEMRAESESPEAVARDQADRAAIMAEFPPAKLGEGMRASLGRLRDSRRRIGLSLRDLASKAGMDPKALSLLERGIGNPTLATVDRVARVMNARAEFVLRDPSSGGVFVAARPSRGSAKPNPARPEEDES